MTGTAPVGEVRTPVRVHGHVAPGFEPVRDAFLRNFAVHGEHGAAVAVHRHGRLVAHLWAGTRDVDAGPDGAPWEAGTAQIVRSATKGVAAALLLLLHRRGALDLDAPVGLYWPEFTAHGKGRVRVRHLLSHRAGLPVLDRPLTPGEALDPACAAGALAAQAPVWEPGTDHGYHPHTFGWLVNELVLRVTGRGIGERIAADVARPLGLDLWVGLPAGQEHRVGRLGPVRAPEPPGAPRIRAKRSVAEAHADPGSLTRRAFEAVSPAADENDPAYRAAALPGSNGIATAESLSRFYAALIGEVEVPAGGGGPGGPSGAGALPAPRGPGGGGAGRGAGIRRVRLFDGATLERARAEESAGADRVLVVGTRFGLGYMLHGAAAPMLGPGSFGHPGRGGALGGV